MTMYELAQFCKLGQLADVDTICRRIEAEREKQGMTQVDFSEQLFICDRSYRRWLKELTFERVLVIAHALDINPMDLLADPDPQGGPPLFSRNHVKRSHLFRWLLFSLYSTVRTGPTQPNARTAALE